jgi:ABC-2 type transport system ATP-binding protein
MQYSCSQKCPFLLSDDTRREFDMITAQGLAKTYRKTRVLRDVSFHVPENHILAVAGANGAGKTTLLKMLALILKPDAGRILIGGEDAGGNPEAFRGRIGYVPQANAFFYDLSVEDNLAYWRDASRGDGAAALLGLGGVMRKKASALSGGMQRRLNLALGLMNDPRILVMDEPLTGVDIATRFMILEWMAALKENGMTIVYSTHHTDEIAHTADSLLLLKEGSLTFNRPIEGLRGEEQLARLFAEFI